MYSMYAVVQFQGHQFIVKKGDTIVVDRLNGEIKSTHQIDDVLCVFDDSGSSVSVGTPYLGSAHVVVSIQEHKKGKKTKVLKFQGKKRYQRIRGFRPQQTVLTVDDIVHG